MLQSLVHAQATTAQPPTGQTTPGVADSALMDSVVTSNPPVPDPVAKVLQFFFGLPSWFQIAGAIVGGIVAVIVLVVLWKKRMAIWGWLTTRSRGAKLALASTAGVLLVALAVMGFAGFHYMEHDNDFCTGCHVMAPAVSKFSSSEHAKLECHDCHKQSMYANARQLVLWVIDRPEEIGKHAPVPTRICAQCHIQEQPDSVWQRISATAGHRLHLESDSAALKDVQCVTCHGVEVHEFAPVDKTCAQSGCHEQTEIRLAKMADQTDLHCTVCHEFTRPINEQISTDSTRRVLVPRQEECFSCHQMREAIRNIDTRTEPHGAKCGACHNPHEQESPAAAFQTCQSSGCHTNPREETPFHRTVAQATLAKCESCHKAHDWEVKSDRCLDCHQDIFSDQPRRPGRSADGSAPAPRHGTRVGAAPAGPPRESSGAVAAAYPAGYHGAAPVRLASLDYVPSMVPMAPQQQQAPQAQQRQQGQGGLNAPFSHRRHRNVECSACHQSSSEKHGQIVVNTPAECQSCHHENNRTGVPAAANMGGGRNVGCATCHQGSELSREINVEATMKLAVSGQARTRELPFRHTQHREEACGTCHTTPVTLAATKGCASCHTEHHQADASCRTCHEESRQAHTVEAHLGCGGAGCHEQARLASGLKETRNVCLTCHQEMVNHKAGRECAACHQVQWLAGRRTGDD